MDWTHERAQVVPTCWACIGREAGCPADVLRVEPDGTVVEHGWSPPGRWLVRVVPNTFPVLVTPAGAYDFGTARHAAAATGDHANAVANPDPSHGIYPQLDALGYSEVSL